MKPYVVLYSGHFNSTKLFAWHKTLIREDFLPLIGKMWQKKKVKVNSLLNRCLYRQNIFLAKFISL